MQWWQPTVSNGWGEGCGVRFRRPPVLKFKMWLSAAHLGQSQGLLGMSPAFCLSPVLLTVTTSLHPHPAGDQVHVGPRLEAVHCAFSVTL